MLKKLKQLLFLYRYLLLKLNKCIHLSGFVSLCPNVQIVLEKDSKLVIGRGCRFKSGTVIYVKKGASLIIGDNTSTGHDTEISVGKHVVIGHDVIMAPYTYITDSNHRFDLQDKIIREQGMDIGTVEIGNDVWIARGAMILKDSRIGNRTVVAAGAIVSKIFPDFVVIGGIPAKILKELR